MTEISKSFSGLEAYHPEAAKSSRRPQKEEDINAVIRAIISGKTEQFEIVVERYRSLILQIGWRLSGNYEDTLDIAQEALLRIYRALSSWKGRAKFSTWMSRIVLNTAIDYIRWQGKHYRGRVLDYEVEANDMMEQIKEGIEETTPLKKALMSELKRKVFHAICRLSGMQRKCFMLRYYHDLKICQIAETLGIKDGTVKRHLSRGANKLRELLNEL